MRVLKHLGKLLRELGEFAWQNKVWWLIPMVLVLLLIALFAVTGQGLAPFIYSFF